MPRQPRLDAPGFLQHVMARGIERRKIFLDDKDRESFLERFAGILEETQTQCYVYPVKCDSLFLWGLGLDPESFSPSPAHWPYSAQQSYAPLNDRIRGDLQ